MKFSKIAFIISVVVLALIILLGLGYLSNYLEISFSSLTRDPLAVAGGKFYYGLLSNIGIILWSITVGVCSLTSLVLYIQTNPKYSFFLSSVLLTTLLLVDDLFMLHEYFYPKFHLSERFLFAIYAVITLAYTVKYYRILFKSNNILFLTSIVFFLSSILADRLHDSKAQFHHLIEDGSKFIGIVLWMTFFIMTAVDFLVTSESQRRL